MSFNSFQCLYLKWLWPQLPLRLQLLRAQKTDSQSQKHFHPKWLGFISRPTLTSGVIQGSVSRSRTNRGWGSWRSNHRSCNVLITCSTNTATAFSVQISFQLFRAPKSDDESRTKHYDTFKVTWNFMWTHTHTRTHSSYVPLLLFFSWWTLKWKATSVALSTWSHGAEAKGSPAALRVRLGDKN